MNDNKKWYYKLTTIFWWVVAIMPILLVLGQFIFSTINRNSTGYDFDNILSVATTYFDDYVNSNGVLSDLYSMFDNLIIDIFGLNGNFAYLMCFILSWFIITHILHLVVDLILLLPKVCQKFIERV